MRRAAIKISSECAALSLSVLGDEGFEVLRTLPSEMGRMDLEFIIRDSVGVDCRLPEECEANLPLRYVELRMRVFTYGSQKMVKVDSFALGEPYQRNWRWVEEIEGVSRAA